jgi:uncharacterized protein (TIGR03435 family)
MLYTAVFVVLTKDGPKFKESPLAPPVDPDGPKKPLMRGDMNTNGRGGSMGMTAPANSMTSFAESLSYMVDRTVIDKTGLKGEYDLHMKWTSDTAPQPAADDAAPLLFTALQQQLGLKLAPSKGPVKTLVVDHVEQLTEN